NVAGNTAVDPLAGVQRIEAPPTNPDPFAVNVVGPDPAMAVLGLIDPNCEPAVTVHVPNCCHPVLPRALPAYIQTCLAPANAEVNIIGTVRVRLFPLGVTDTLRRSRLHWLF